jgi:hypothetical protein
MKEIKQSESPSSNIDDEKLKKNIKDAHDIPDLDVNL